MLRKLPEHFLSSVLFCLKRGWGVQGGRGRGRYSKILLCLQRVPPPPLPTACAERTQERQQKLLTARFAQGGRLLFRCGLCPVGCRTNGRTQTGGTPPADPAAAPTDRGRKNRPNRPDRGRAESEGGCHPYLTEAAPPEAPRSDKRAEKKPLFVSRLHGSL